ncbi:MULTISPECIES: putative ABC transporter permease [unclassified Paenibacillus]|uniref:putative ABC transporter permease n=1 Tax=unclassified Paenibacillus TaxID=185978 RepID=UPI0024066EC6|nr:MULTISPECIES: putative ABC transporter permease [unclassified Paenibacillus]MDF9842532.1 putative membrane protein [Paenibacillus sp. PastF-2]MDF9849261.1 putative membrane protein [Paenibacillus sp. PastM-2]MDF9855692.1 putative membrane protein [Paenibacillus sp. PastF-1]MDH6481102.1 putative membrane protein [Paenibacillus sp. PastH-2]MDH6508386.1 putative membrane protein [Paenibacillus sp. PastM-3]
MNLFPLLSPGSDSAFAAAGQYFFYFAVYSFLGWVLEGTYNLYSRGTFRKEGFLKGPVKPMYGFAPLLLLSVQRLELPLPVYLLLALIIPSLVEYASGWLLKTFFRRQWWDYSDMPRQLHGHICLKFSLYWWVLSAGCIYALHPLIELLYPLMEPVWLPALPLIAVMFLADMLWTFRIRRRSLAELEHGEG